MTTKIDPATGLEVTVTPLPTQKQLPIPGIDIVNAAPKPYTGFVQEEGITSPDLEYQDQINIATDNQSGWQQLRRSIGVGTLSGILTALDSTLNMFEQVDKEERNALGKFVDENKEWLREEYPIYRKELDSPFSLEGGTLAEMVSSILDSGIGFAAPGLAAAKALSFVTKAARYANILRMSDKTSDIVNTIGTGILSNQAESRVMATETYKQARQELSKAVEAGYITDEQAREYASQASTDMYLSNRVFALTNMYQASSLFKYGRGVDNIIEANTFKQFTKEFIKQGFTESGEEMGQGILDSYIIDNAKNKAGLYTHDSSTAALLDYITDHNNLYEGLIGFGGGVTEFNMIKKGLSIRNNKDYYQGDYAVKQQEFIGQLGTRIKESVKEVEVLNTLQKKLIDDGDNKGAEVLVDVNIQSLASKAFNTGTVRAVDEQLDQYAKDNPDKTGEVQEIKEKLQTYYKQYNTSTKYENQGDVYKNLNLQQVIGIKQNLVQSRIDQLSSDLQNTETEEDIKAINALNNVNDKLVTDLQILKDQYDYLTSDEVQNETREKRKQEFEENKEREKKEAEQEKVIKENSKKTNEKSPSEKGVQKEFSSETGTGEVIFDGDRSANTSPVPTISSNPTNYEELKALMLSKPTKEERNSILQKNIFIEHTPKQLVELRAIIEKGTVVSKPVKDLPPATEPDLFDKVLQNLGLDKKSTEDPIDDPNIPKEETEGYSVKMNTSNFEGASKQFDTIDEAITYRNSLPDNKKIEIVDNKTGEIVAIKGDVEKKSDDEKRKRKEDTLDSFEITEEYIQADNELYQVYYPYSNTVSMSHQAIADASKEVLLKIEINPSTNQEVINVYTPNGITLLGQMKTPDFNETIILGNKRLTVGQKVELIKKYNAFYDKVTKVAKEGIIVKVNHKPKARIKDKTKSVSFRTLIEQLGLETDEEKSKVQKDLYNHLYFINEKGKLAKASSGAMNSNTKVEKALNVHFENDKNARLSGRLYLIQPVEDNDGNDIYHNVISVQHPKQLSENVKANVITDILSLFNDLIKLERVNSKTLTSESKNKALNIMVKLENLFNLYFRNIIVGAKTVSEFRDSALSKGPGVYVWFEAKTTLHMVTVITDSKGNNSIAGIKNEKGEYIKIPNTDDSILKISSNDYLSVIKNNSVVLTPLLQQLSNSANIKINKVGKLFNESNKENINFTNNFLDELTTKHDVQLKSLSFKDASTETYHQYLIDESSLPEVETTVDENVATSTTISETVTPATPVESIVETSIPEEIKSEVLQKDNTFTPKRINRLGFPQEGTVLFEGDDRVSESIRDKDEDTTQGEENIALFPERKELVEKSRFTVQGVSNSYLYKVMNTILRDFKEMLIKENLTKSSSTELKEILKDFIAFNVLEDYNRFIGTRNKAIETNNQKLYNLATSQIELLEPLLEDDGQLAIYNRALQTAESHGLDLGVTFTEMQEAFNLSEDDEVEDNENAYDEKNIDDDGKGEAFDDDAAAKVDVQKKMLPELKTIFNNILLEKNAHLAFGDVYMDADDVFNTVMLLLMDRNPFGTYIDIIDLLKQEAKTRTWLTQVVEQLEASEDYVKNGFVTYTTMHYAPAYYLVYDVKSYTSYAGTPAATTKKYYNFKLFEENKNETYQLILDQWRDNYLRLPFVKRVNETHFTLDLETEEAKESYEKFRELFDKVKELHKSLPSTTVEETRGQGKFKKAIQITTRPDEFYNALAEALNFIGMNEVNGEVIKDVDLYGGKLTGNQSTVISDTSSLLQYLLNFESIIRPFNKQLLTPKELKDFKLPIDGVLSSSSHILLARLAAKHSDKKLSTFYLTGGKGVYKIEMERYIHNVFNRLNIRPDDTPSLRARKEAEINKLINDNYAVSNYLLKDVFLETGQYNPDSFLSKMEHAKISISALKNKYGKAKSKSGYDELSAVNREMIAVNLFAKMDVQGNTWFIDPTFSDKKEAHLHKMQGLRIAEGVEDPVVYEALRDNLVLSDLMQMLFPDNEQEQKKRQVVGYSKLVDEQIFFGLPILNETNYENEEIQQKINDFKRIVLEERRFGFESDRFNRGTDQRVIKLDKEANDLLRTILNEVIVQLTNRKLEQWKEMDIVGPELKFLDQNSALHSGTDKIAYKTIVENERERQVFDEEAFARMFITNYLLFNSTFQQLFIGPPQTFFGKNGKNKKELLKNTLDNMFKRFAGVFAPKFHLAQITGDEQIRYIVGKTNKLNVASWDSPFFKELAKRSWSPQDLEDETEPNKPYSEIDGTDAAEFWIPEFFINYQYKQGVIKSKAQYNALMQKAINEDIFDEDELKVLLHGQGEKAVYYGQHADIRANFYVKSAQFPLFPQFIQNTPYAKIYRILKPVKGERAIADSYAFDSAVKQGMLIGKLHDLNDTTDGQDITSKIIQVPLNGLGKQQDVPYKESGKVVDATQNRMLLYGGIKPNTMIRRGGKLVDFKEHKKSFNQTYSQVYENQKRAFINDIAIINKDGSIRYEQFSTGKPNLDRPIIDRKKLNNLLVENAVSLGASPREIEGLLLDKNGEFEIPLLFSSMSKRVQNMMMSVAEKRLFKLKTSGESHILMSDVDMGKDENDFIRGSIVKIDGHTGPLLGQRVEEVETLVINDQQLDKNISNRKNASLTFVNEKSDLSAIARGITKTDAGIWTVKYFDKNDKITIFEGTDVEELRNKVEDLYDQEFKSNYKKSKRKVTKGAQVVVPFRFKYKGELLKLTDFLDENGQLDMSRFPRELLESFGYRIPTSGHNSMTMIEIVGFLPESYGNVIIASPTLITQMGQDFDVDKLYRNWFNYQVKETFTNDGVKDLVEYKIEQLADRYDIRNSTNDDSDALIIERLIEDSKQSEEDFERRARILIIKTKRKYKDGLALDDLETAILNQDRSVVVEKVMNLLKKNYQPLTIQQARAKLYDMRKQLLQNVLLRHRLEVLSTPEIFNNTVVKPISYGKLEQLAKDEVLDGQTFIDESMFTSQQYQTSKYSKGRVGKIGTSSFSMDMVFNAFIEHSDMVIPYNGRMLSFSFSKANTEITNPYSLSGHYKNDIFSYFQNSSLDEAKMGILAVLGISGEAFNIIRSMALFGHDEITIARVLQVPIVKEFIKLKEIQQGEGAEYKTNDEIFDLVTKEYKKNSKIANIKDPKSKQAAIESIQSWINNSMTKEMLKDIVKGTFDDKVNQGIYDVSFNSADIQLFIIETAFDLDEYGQEIRNLQSAFNQDSKGLPSTIYEARIREKNRFEVWDQYTDETGKNSVQYLMNKDNIKGKTVELYEFATGIWSDFYSATQLDRIVARIEQSIRLNGSGITKKITLTNSVARFLKTMVYSYIPGLIENPDATRKRLFYSNKEENKLSLAGILHAMKQDDAVKNYIEENLPFVAALNTSIKDETKIDQIIFPSSRKKGYDDVNLPASIEQMLNDDKTDLGTFNGITYTPYKLAIDLYRYEVLRGAQEGPIQYMKYFPVSFEKLFGVHTHLKKYQNLVEFTDSSFIDALNQEFIQNNPKLAQQFIVANEDKNGYSAKGRFRKNKNDTSKGLNSRFIYYDATIDKNKSDRLYNYDSQYKNVTPLEYVVIYDKDDENVVTGYKIYKFKRILTGAKTASQVEELSLVDEINNGVKLKFEYEQIDNKGTSHFPEANLAHILMHGTPSKSIIDGNNVKDTSSPEADNATQKQYKKTLAEINYGIVQNGNVLALLENIKSKASSNAHRMIAEFLLSKPEIFKNIIIDIPKTSYKGHDYYYDPKTKTISISAEAIDNDNLNVHAIIEELLHSITTDALKGNNSDPKVKAIVQKLNVLYKTSIANYIDLKRKTNPSYSKADFELDIANIKHKVISNDNDYTLYRLQNLPEFVAGLFHITTQNKQFKETLSKKVTAKQYGTFLKITEGLYDKIKQLISDLLDALGFTSTIDRFQLAINYSYALMEVIGDNTVTKFLSSQPDITKLDEEKNEPTSNVDVVDTADISSDGSIILTPHQQEALTKIKDFLNDPNEQFGTLKGRGGTGKTTIVKEIFKNINPGSILYLAPTHKAKNVLAMSTGKEAKTLASALFIDVNEKTGKFEPNEYKRKLFPIPIQQYKYIVIDESSMINDMILDGYKDNKGAFIKGLKDLLKPGQKVLFMGDNAQLPPVGQDSDSKVFNYTKAELLQIVRQKEFSPILQKATQIAENIESTNPKLDVIENTTSFDKESNSGLITLNDSEVFLESWKRDYLKNPKSTKIITFNNESHSNPQSVKNVNRIVRYMLYGDNPEWIYVNEQLTAYDTLLSESGDPIIENSVDYTISSMKNVSNISKTISAYSKRNGNRELTIDGLNGVEAVLIDNITGQKTEPLFLPDPISKERIDKEKKNQFNTGDAQMGVLIGQAFPNMEYGYAVTSHKAQGSTYRNAYVLKDNILFSDSMRKVKNKNQSLYVAVSRASDKLVIHTVKNNNETGSEYLVNDPNQSTHLSKVNKQNVNKTPKQILEASKYSFLLPIINYTGLKLNWTTDESVDGTYYPGKNKADINKNAFDLETSIAHEVLHSIIDWETTGTKKRKELESKLIPFINELKDIFKNDPNGQNEYIKQILKTFNSNLIKENGTYEEVITYAFTDKTFAEWLNSLPTKGVKNVSKTMWGKLKDIILEFVTPDIGKSKLDELNEILDSIFIENPVGFKNSTNKVLNYPTVSDLIDNPIRIIKSVSFEERMNRHLTNKVC